MEFIDVAVDDGIAYLRLNRNKSNALNLEMIVEMREALVQILANQAARGMIIMGKDGFFSAGMDLKVLYDYNPDELKHFWHEFIKLIRTFISFDKPAVAAINGHSPAGGCLLSLCCDYRIIGEGEFVIGLNELPVGIIVPQSVFALYAFWIGQAQAYRFLLDGKLMHPQEALKVGLVDEIAPVEKIVTTAERKLRRYFEFEPKSWKASKVNLRTGLIDLFDQDPSPDIDSIVSQWWSPETRTMLKTILEGLNLGKT